MKLRCLTIAAILALFAISANSASPYLRVENKFGDYWILRFNGLTLNLTFDVDHKTQQISDREVKLTDIDLTFGGLPLSSIVVRPQGSNLLKIRLLCKNPGCVYSHYETNTYNELDIICNLQQDCLSFAQVLH
jgi:hypothetical protein